MWGGISQRYLSPHIGDPDVITHQGQQVALPTLQPRHCPQLSIWYHCSTKMDTTDIHSDTQHHDSHRPQPHHRHHQSSKCLILNGTGSRFYVSPSQLIPQCRSPPTLPQLTVRPSPLTDDCLIASTWDYAANTRSASINPNDRHFPARFSP
jgi:hypothetical protein